MANESPASILFSRDGYDVVITDGYSITSDQPGIISVGKDGSTTRFIAVNSSGNSIVVGPGTAGAPVGGVLSVQGVVGGTAVPVSGAFTSNDIVASGTITANGQSVTTLDLNGIGTAAIQISGTWAATLQFEGTVDGITYVSINVRGANTSTLSTSTTANGLFLSGIGGLLNIRVRSSAFTSGTATITIRQSSSDSAVYLTSSLPVGNSVIGAVTGSGTFTVNASATVGIVDNAAFPGTTRIQPSGYIFDETAGAALTENNGAAARIDSKRAQILVIEDKTTRGQRLTITASNAMKIDGSAVTQPISAASLPLPTGAGTEATLATLLAESTFTSRINTLGQKTMANSTPVVISSDQSAITVSGTVTSNQGTPAALANAWPILVSDGTNINTLTNASPIGNEQALVVRNIPSGTQTISGIVTATVSGTVTANQGTPASLSNPWPVQLSNGTNTPIITNTTPGGSDQALVVRNIPSGTQAISVASLPLPTGAATETTLGTRLADSTFTSRINTLGQKTMANSTPIVIASDQTVIPVSDNGGSLTIDGTVTANAGTGTFAVSGTVAATQSGTWTIQPGNTANTTPWLTTISQGGNAATVSGTGALKIDGSAVTQPISVASLPLPTGAATEATLATLLTESIFTSRINTLGQKTMANSTPVVLASDQTVIPVSDNGSSITIDNPVLSVVGGGTEATAQRVTIASDSTGVLSVDDNGGSLTIDGTVTANQGTSPWVTNITQFGSTNISTGTGASGSGIPRVTISNDSNILATQSGTWTVQQGTPPWTIIGIASDNTTNSTNKLPVLPARANTSPPSWTDGYQAPLSTLLTGALRTDVTSWLGSTAPTVGQKPMASSIPVTLSSNQTPLAVTFNAVGDIAGVSFGLRKLGGGTASLLFPMLATTYTEPATQAKRSISSSSGSDSSAGTGARTVKITYYDNAGAGPFEETITLNGTTAVNTVATDIRFIEKMNVITVGANASNVGTISLYSSTGGAGTVIGSIGIDNILTGIGDNSTLWCHHYVGAGLTAKFSVIVIGIQSGGSATNGLFFIRYSMPLVSNASEILLADAILVVGTFERSFTFNPSISGFARVTAYGIPGVNNTTMTCSFDWSEQ